VGEIVVTISPPKIVRRAVLRDLAFNASGGLVLEASSNGTSWSQLASVSAGGTSGGDADVNRYREIELTAPASPVSQVRLRWTGTETQGAKISGLSELSVFE
jgi:hypothetical protein